MTPQAEPNDVANILKDALSEAQATVRSYDTKAQIVGVGYIFALGIVGKVSDLLPNARIVDTVAVLVAWAAVIFPILLFGYVLYPSRKTFLDTGLDPEERIEHVLYIDPSRHGTVEALKASAAKCNPANEYAFELIKVSRLRELKRKRFLRALFASAASFLFLFASQVFRGL